LGEIKQAGEPAKPQCKKSESREKKRVSQGKTSNGHQEKNEMGKNTGYCGAAPNFGKKKSGSQKGGKLQRNEELKLKIKKWATEGGSGQDSSEGKIGGRWNGGVTKGFTRGVR